MQIGVLARPASKRQRLQEGRAGLDRVHAWFRDATDKVDAIAPDLLDHHRDIRVLHGGAEALRDDLGELRDRQVLRLDLTGQRERDLSIGPDDDGLLEIFVVPDDDVQHVVGTNLVVVLRRAGGDTRPQDRESDQQAGEKRFHGPPGLLSAGLSGTDILVVLGILAARLSGREPVDDHADDPSADLFERFLRAHCGAALCRAEASHEEDAVHVCSERQAVRHR